MPTWFITGAARGIGLQIVKQLSANTENIVVASCRNPEAAQELSALQSTVAGKVHIVKIELNDGESIKAAAVETSKILGDQGLDYLLNNAAINMGIDEAFNTTSEELVKMFQNNVVGPALTAQAFLPLLEKGNRKVIMNTTSGLASVGLNIGSKCASYSISKAALNMLTYKQHAERSDIISFVLDPGWVKTKMGGEGAQLEPEQSVTPMLKFLHSVNREQSGKFFIREGQPIPW